MRIFSDIMKGERSKKSVHLLDIGEAELANNCKLVDGELRAFKAMERTAALTDTDSITIEKWSENGNAHWLESANDLDFIDSPVADEQFERKYYTGETEPRFLANDNISVGGFDFTADYYKLGVTAPTAAPTLTAGGGATYRAYFYVFVNSYGEPGPNSPVASVSDFNTGYVQLDDIEAVPANRAVTTIWVYRTADDGAGNSEFLFVCEATYFDASTAYASGDYVVYSNSLYKCTTIHPAGAWNAGHFTAGENVGDSSLGDPAFSTDFDPPDSSMEGLISLPNGVCAGFAGNQLFLSEPYYPHAYPYTLSYDSDIVAISVAGDTIVIMTTDYVHLAWGTHPSAMSKKKITTLYPCANKRSVSRYDDGVFFASTDGLIMVKGGTAVNVTFDLISRDVWQALSPSTIHGDFHGPSYFGFNLSGGFVLDFGNNIKATLSTVAYGTYLSKTDAKLYLIVVDPSDGVGKAIVEWEGDSDNYLNYTWKSGEFRLDFNTNFSHAFIDLDPDFYDDIVDGYDFTVENAVIWATGIIGGTLGSNTLGAVTLGGNDMESVASYDISDSVTFKLFCEGEQRFAKSVDAGRTIFALPAGYEGSKFQVELSGNVPVRAWAVAPSIEELQGAEWQSQ